MLLNPRYCPSLKQHYYYSTSTWANEVWIIMVAAFFLCLGWAGEPVGLQRWGVAQGENGMINNNKQRIDFWTKVPEDLVFKRYTTCIRIFQLIAILILNNWSQWVIVWNQILCVYVTCQCVLCVCVHCVCVCLCLSLCVIKTLKMILLYPAVLHVIFSWWKPVSVDRPIHSTCPSMGLCLWTPLPAPSLPSHAGLRPLVSSHTPSSNYCPHFIPATVGSIIQIHSQSLFSSFHSLPETEQIFVSF